MKKEFKAVKDTLYKTLKHFRREVWLWKGSLHNESLIVPQELRFVVKKYEEYYKALMIYGGFLRVIKHYKKLTGY